MYLILSVGFLLQWCGVAVEIMLGLVYGILIFFVLICVIGVFCLSVFKKKLVVDGSWRRPYECGFSSDSLRFNCFRFTYFSLLVFFVIFDLEISLLLNMPEQLELFSKFVYYKLFLFVLVFSFIFEVIIGYVRWGY